MNLDKYSIELIKTEKDKIVKIIVNPIFLGNLLFGDSRSHFVPFQRPIPRKLTFWNRLFKSRVEDQIKLAEVEASEKVIGSIGPSAFSVLNEERLCCGATKIVKKKVK